MDVMHGKRFGNQTKEQVLKHLGSLMDPEARYDFSVDILGIYYTIREGAHRKKDPGRREYMREMRKDLTKGERKHLATRKIGHPKIRSFKKGRTINLKGRVY